MLFYTIKFFANGVKKQEEMESANIMNREKSLFERMGGTYRQVGDYLIPNIILKSEIQTEQIGKYGFLRGSYLKEYRKARYQSLLLQDKLGEHLLDVDRTAREREEKRSRRNMRWSCKSDLAV